MLLVRVRNSPRSIKKNSNMNPRLSGYISILGLVFYVLKTLLGIARHFVSNGATIASPS